MIKIIKVTLSFLAQFWNKVGRSFNLKVAKKILTLNLTRLSHLPTWFNCLFQYLDLKRFTEDKRLKRKNCVLIYYLHLYSLHMMKHKNHKKQTSK